MNPSLSPVAIKMYETALETGDQAVADFIMSSPRAALPSLEEIKAQLGGNLSKEKRDIVIIGRPDDATA